MQPTKKDQLVNQIKPMILRAWNINFEEKCLSVDIKLNYFPDIYDGENPPIIGYKLFMINGRKQDRENCSKPFVSLINSLVKYKYESLMGLEGQK
jgi:hypothetical protein